MKKSKSERHRPKPPHIVRFVLAVILIALYVPLICVVAGAFRQTEGLGAFNWFQEVLQDDVLLAALWNSITVGLCASLGATVLGAGAAIAIYRGRFWGRPLLEILSYVSLVLPEIVFALALLSWFFVLNIPLGLPTVIMAHITFSISYVILTVGSRLASFDPSLDDAARDLGASELQILWKVTLPILGPSLVASFLLSFLLSFDDFLITFFVNGVGSDTLPVKLYGFMKIGITPKLNALATIMWALTALVLFVSFRSPAFRGSLKGETET
jgi:spermidine/putrescine transport system permease protein